MNETEESTQHGNHVGSCFGEVVRRSLKGGLSSIRSQVALMLSPLARFTV